MMSHLSKPLVTIVIPLHNYQAYIQDCIRSVQAQTLTNYECYIVNDASTDDSEAVALKAIDGDSRFHVLNVNNRNLSATRNDGIAAGSGLYVCCLDADDMIAPDFLEILVTALEQDRTLGIAYSSLRVMDANGVPGHVPSWPPAVFDAEGQYNHINQMPTCNVFLRELWRRTGGYRESYFMVEDAEHWTTAIDIGYGAIHATTEPLFLYRLHDKSASQVHRTGEVPEPDWLEYHPWSKDGQRPLAAGGRPPRGSWPVRFYNEPDVSIIIPVGVGHERAVKDALHSVEGQTHRFWECIVVNDSGNDLQLENGFPWVREMLSNTHMGAGAVRNQGASYAKGDYLVFLDADDMLKPTFLEDTLKAYKQNGRYVYTDWLTHERQTNWQVHETPDYSFEALFNKPSLHPVTCLIPRYWFENVGGFDTSLPAFEDVDLFMKLLTHGYCGVRVKKPLFIYNLNSGKRRKSGEAYEPTFKKLLKQRYGAYMEDRTMCNCVEPPKGKQPAAPTLENAADFKEAYGEMILAKLVGERVAEAPVSFRGPATRVSYGRRAKGDVFYIWEADLLNGGDTFEKIENYTVEPVVTVVPPPPVVADTPLAKDQIAALSTPSDIPTVEQILSEAAMQHMVDPTSGHIEKPAAPVVPMSQRVSAPRGKGKRK